MTRARQNWPRVPLPSSRDALLGSAGLSRQASLLRDTEAALDDMAFWRNVPAQVWTYTLGGYQVMKKWLSYREKSLLGHGLTLEEVTEVTHMARRIAALLLLTPALDANYQAVKAATYAWGEGSKTTGKGTA
jgi:hypothetical protein